jgi:hypothetical protein
MTGQTTHRVRRGRMCAAVAALLVTLIAVLGGVGVLPTGVPAAAARDSGGASRASLSAQTVTDQKKTEPPPRQVTAQEPYGADLPAKSGEGRRIVFDMSDQRVWLVDADDDVRRSYPVSGSLTDNLHPGTYAVYSRSRWAVGVDDSGTMEFFVRFTHGDNAAIGFHSIPTKDGHLVQTRRQLGTPQSHGCIRQARPDAIRLWDFAPIGTKVVVTA